MAEGMIPGGLLASIGRGLKLGGGVLNPAIHEQQVQERALAQQQAQARKDALMQLIFSAVGEGAIDKDTGRKALEAGGASPELLAALGQSAATRKAQTEYEYQQKQREALRRIAAGLEVDPDAPEDVIIAAYKAQNPSASTSKTEYERLLSAKDAAVTAGDTARAAAIDQRILKLTNIPARQGTQSEAVNLVLPDGMSATGRERPDGTLEMLTDSGYKPVPPGTRLIGMTATGTPSDLGVTRKDQAGLRDQRIATRQALGVIDDITKQVRGKPELLSASGWLTRTADTVLAQAEGLAALTGVNLSASRDPGSYAEEFRKIGGPAAQSAQLQSAIVNLSYAAAAASGQTGRDVTDKDVARFVREIGANTGSPDTFIAVLDALKQRLDRNYRIRAEETEGKTPPSFLGAEEPQMAEPKTQAEFDALPAGTLFRDPDDGKVYRK